MPAVGKVVPASGIEMPAIGSVMPAIGSLMPVIGSVVPAIGSLMPIIGSLMPVIGRVVPPVGIMMPVIGSVMPTVRILVPTARIVVPTAGTSVQITGRRWPYYGRMQRDHGQQTIMLRILVAVLLLAACGCSTPDPSAEPGGETNAAQPTAASTPSAAPALPFTDKVWVRSDSTGLPGVLRMFLSDGTLVMDSCWETYRLARWRALPDGAVVWEEDGAEIQAQVAEASETALVLRLALVGGGTAEEQYRKAEVPYVCPDMPR